MTVPPPMAAAACGRPRRMATRRGATAAAAAPAAPAAATLAASHRRRRHEMPSGRPLAMQRLAAAGSTRTTTRTMAVIWTADRPAGTSSGGHRAVGTCCHRPTGALMSSAGASAECLVVHLSSTQRCRRIHGFDVVSSRMQHSAACQPQRCQLLRCQSCLLPLHMAPYSYPGVSSGFESFEIKSAGMAASTASTSRRSAAAAALLGCVTRGTARRAGCRSWAAGRPTRSRTATPLAAI